MVNERGSCIFLSRQALQFNLDFLKAEFGPEVLISSVVKGNAYGHGIETFVPMAAACGIRHFSVFSSGEAIRVKNSLGKHDISLMIMGYIDDLEWDWVILNEVEFFVFDLQGLQKALAGARRLGKKACIHLELETGMNRTGFDKATLIDQVLPLLRTHADDYRLMGICTHFAGAESIANYLRVEKQKQAFLKLKTFLLQEGLRPKYIHACCSAAAIRFKNMRFNMVRIGILQYGLWPSPEIKIEYMRHKKLSLFNLHRILTWKSKIMTIKQVKMGAFVGYGNSFQAAEDLSVGIVPVGYANGYSRVLSNSGTVIVNGKRVAVLGNVNMNSLVIDLRHIPQARPGDEVILIGEAGANEISVASFGELSNQLNYELLTRLPMDIPRLCQEQGG